jgi:hypothetical protein
MIPEFLAPLGDRLREFPLIAGHVIYLLFDDDQIVYVGRTKTLGSRLHAHRRDCRRFNRAFYFPVAEEDAAILESALIVRLDPPGNLLPEFVSPVSLREVLERCGLEHSEEFYGWRISPKVAAQTRHKMGGLR